MDTLTQSQAPIRCPYSLKWAVFAQWCEENVRDVVNCPVSDILMFLQHSLDVLHAVHIKGVCGCYFGFSRELRKTLSGHAQGVF